MGFIHTLLNICTMWSVVNISFSCLNSSSHLIVFSRFACCPCAPLCPRPPPPCPACPPPCPPCSSCPSPSSSSPSSFPPSSLPPCLALLDLHTPQAYQLAGLRRWNVKHKPLWQFSCRAALNLLSGDQDWLWDWSSPFLCPSQSHRGLALC